MKPNLFIKSLLLMLFAALMTIDVHAQNIQVYRDGVLIATYDESNVDEVTFSANSVVFKRGESTVVYSGADLDKITFKETNAPHEYVDLGLPSGTLWATCNVGADAPEDYGGYYAWGETETKSFYGWSTYSLCDGTEKILNKYCWNSNYGLVDNLTRLEPKDDVAHVLWGDKWFIPSEEDWAELHVNCTWQTVTINNVKGHKVTGPNGKSIFLPFGGERYNDRSANKGTMAYYWASGLKTNAKDPKEALYYNYYRISSSMRSFGQNVRPVYRDNVKTVAKELEVSNTKITIPSLYESDFSGWLDIKCNSFWTTKSNVNWLISGSDEVGIGDGEIKIMGDENKGTKPRTATITVICGDLTREITVIQDIKHEYVDLGLSVKWATCNIGALTPEEYGDYYAWGETETKDYYDWSTYKWGTQNSLTKYNKNTNQQVILEQCDDAAIVKWGMNWRMPTIEEFIELKENCTWTWTSIKGIRGYEVRSNKPGYTNKSIFLPAAGWYYKDNKENYNGGDYWTNTRAKSPSSFAGVFSFYDDYGYDSVLERCCGLPIRPVYQEQQ